MGFNLFPKSVKFFNLFMEQNQRLVTAARALRDIATEFTNVEELCNRINVLEGEGNAISRDIARQLSSTFITPIDREDIHEINLQQEEALNLIKSISIRMSFYDLNRIRYPAKKMIQLLCQMIEESGEALASLSRRKEFDKNVNKIKSLSYECEMILVVAIGELYDWGANPSKEEIFDIIKWEHIYDRIERAIKRTETLGDVFEGILLKNA